MLSFARFLFCLPLLLAACGEITRVGVVVSYSASQSSTFPVTLDKDNPTAKDALEATGLDLTYGFGGAALCAIEEVGESEADCFTGSMFWAFFMREEGSFTSSLVGIAETEVKDKDVIGFAWSGFDESFNPTRRPPDTAFEDIFTGP